MDVVDLGRNVHHMLLPVTAAIYQNLSNLPTCAVTFGLHRKKQMSLSFTIDTAIARIQEVYEYDCPVYRSSQSLPWDRSPETQGLQGTVSSVVVEEERRILLALGEIGDLFRKYAPQLLDVLKLKCLLTLVVENFFSEMRAGASDMPMQLQFDFRFSRAMKVHSKQMCTTRFSYYTSATSHYLRVKSDLKYSALPKMSPHFYSTVDKATSSANKRLAHEVWSKCSTEDCAQQEHQR